MSRAYGWRASCPAGGVTDVGVGSGAWFGSVFCIRATCCSFNPRRPMNIVITAYANKDRSNLGLAALTLVDLRNADWELGSSHVPIAIIAPAARPARQPE